MIEGDSSDWDDVFQQKLVPAVLSYVIETWEEMPKPGITDVEDAISVKLYSALIKAKDRSKHPFLIKYQDVEVDTDLAKETGRKDIVFYPAQEEEIYFCLEAKRLNAKVSERLRSLADEYVKEGMQRFVDKKYSGSVRHGAMLAYVLDGRTKHAMEQVEKNIRARFKELQMESASGFRESSVRPRDLSTKETHHNRAGETKYFCIHHMFMGDQIENRAQKQK